MNEQSKQEAQKILMSLLGDIRMLKNNSKRSRETRDPEEDANIVVDDDRTLSTMRNRLDELEKLKNQLG